MKRRDAKPAAAFAAIAPAGAVDALSPHPSDGSPAARDALISLATENDDLRHQIASLKRRLAEAEGLADRDAVTPLLNRRGFMRELDRIMAYVRRYRSPACLIYFDLDRFKAINDRLGHAAGDAALMAVAARLSEHVRAFDVVGRLGGDEFGVILVHASVEDASTKAAGLAAAVEAEPVYCPNGSAALKISYGVRALDPDGSINQMLADADAAMFARKRAG